jgi:hypothetical protein
VKCAHCKQDHPTVAEVRACAGTHGIFSSQLGRPRYARAPQTIRPASPVERLKAAADKLPAVPHAHYAVQDDDAVWRFYKVDKPESGTWAGRTFVSRQLSEDYVTLPFSQSLAVLDEIARDPKAALEAYGHELGQCGVCNRTLTNPESIEAGIGPICAARL